MVLLLCACVTIYGYLLLVLQLQLLALLAHELSYFKLAYPNVIRIISKRQAWTIMMFLGTKCTPKIHLV